MYKISISPEEIESLDLGCFTGEIQVIDKEGEAFSKAIAYLRRQKIIGFDTESRPSFGPSQPRYGVSLLQLSGPEKAFLFRIKSLGMHKKLCSILSSERIIKVGAAVNDDVRGLERYNNFEAKSFVDLQKIGWQYGIRDKSVKKMSAIILGIRISKTQQLSNWEADRLSEAQQRYAATDAWVCREMYLKLMKSEKHPLTPEEQMPPAQLQQMLLKKQQAEEKAKADASGTASESTSTQPKSKKNEQKAKRKRLYNKRRRERKRKQNKERKLAQQNNNNGKGNTEER
ncbi:MAG: 3'-5' exonuclease domain-containing protein 2 [Bacteroidales bacterium]|nr:3'-5' exonuclease domain-containing protein 2 [Bacteroidales bacterium]